MTTMFVMGGVAVLTVVNLVQLVAEFRREAQQAQPKDKTLIIHFDTSKVKTNLRRLAADIKMAKQYSEQRLKAKARPLFVDMTISLINIEQELQRIEKGLEG